MTDAAGNKDSFGIGAVAKLTGLTDHTIRVWERRYEAVVAERAANGRRVYTSADVEKLRLLKLLTDKGISISQIAGDPIDELRWRLESMSKVVAATVPDRIATVVLGDFLAGKLLSTAIDLAPLDLVVVDTDRDRFEADLSRHSADVVVVENAVLDAPTIERVRDYMSVTGAARGMIIYSFGKTADVERANGMDIGTLLSPVSEQDVHAAVIRSHAAPAVRRTAVPHVRNQGADAPWQLDEPPAPRRFSQQQLANLAAVSSPIECECPKHLAQLVSDLSAFEVYSSNCANRNDEDAALHRYLHHTTARARALIEEALETVAVAEGLSF